MNPWSRRQPPVRGGRRVLLASLVLGLGALLALSGCSSSATPTPTSAVATPFVLSSNSPISLGTPTDSPTSTTTATPEPTQTPIVLPTETPVLAVPPDQGNYVTSSLPRAHYYYYYTDPRWKTMEDPVWFHTLDDLVRVYPDRVPAP